MPRTLPVDVAAGNLQQLLDGMVPGEELVLTSNGEKVAVVSRPPRRTWPCQPGTAKDRSFWMAPDFDAPLGDFSEYME
ncbi:MAG: type II toxin-antitoxin system Phd/YefM family antitoxin [Planctomycetota bacterium]